MSGYLYRFYDAEGALLYIGSTKSIAERVKQHKHKAPFFGDIHRTDVTVYETLAAARGAEILAIGEERPLHNKQNNGNHSDYVLPEWVDKLLAARERPEDQPVERIANWSAA
jgi:predicted GIY-YIG superfamily endonuclease